MKILDVLENKFHRGKDQKDESIDSIEQQDKNMTTPAVATAPSEAVSASENVTLQNSLSQKDKKKFPKPKTPGNVHMKLRGTLRVISFCVCKYLIYQGGIYKDHYISCSKLQALIDNITRKHGPLKKPDLTSGLITPSNTPLLVIDARRPDEYAISHIAGAINIHSILSRRLSRHMQNVDLNTPVIVYCAVGLRSGWSSTRLRRMGFKNVRTLEGAYYQWATEGRPIVGPSGEPTQKVLPQHFLAALLLDKEIRALKQIEEEKKKAKEEGKLTKFAIAKTKERKKLFRVRRLKKARDAEIIDKLNP